MPDSVVVQLPADAAIEAHNAGLFLSQGRGRHPDRVIDSYELIFVSQGVLGMYEGDGAFTLPAGHALILTPGRPHGGIADYPSDLRFYWVHFSVRDNAALAGARPVPQTTAVARPERLTELFRHFLDDQESGSADPLSSGLLVMLMLGEVARKSREGRSGPGFVLAQRAQAHIRTQFIRPISTSSIAAALDCHPDYLGRVYAAAYGCTVTEAIHQQRLSRACELLLHSPFSIAEIARRCGFEDPGYFRRLFRRAKGMPPQAYRRLYARVHVNSE